MNTVWNTTCRGAIVVLTITVASHALAAAGAMRSIAPRVAVVGRGACAAQSVLFAALIGREIGWDAIDFVAGLEGIRHYGECFSGEVLLLALQPRAAYSVPLEKLQALEIRSEFWTFHGDGDVDLVALIEQQVGG